MILLLYTYGVRGEHGVDAPPLEADLPGGRGVSELRDDGRRGQRNTS